MEFIGESNMSGERKWSMEISSYLDLYFESTPMSVSSPSSFIYGSLVSLKDSCPLVKDYCRPMFARSIRTISSFFSVSSFMKNSKVVPIFN